MRRRLERARCACDKFRYLSIRLKGWLAKAALSFRGVVLLGWCFVAIVSLASAQSISTSMVVEFVAVAGVGWTESESSLIRWRLSSTLGLAE